MANTLSPTGIQTNQTIEASQVSQSIDAFTGAAPYDITISGSLELTGTGSLTTAGAVTFTEVVTNTSPDPNTLNVVNIDANGRLFSGTPGSGTKGAPGTQGTDGQKGQKGEDGQKGVQGIKGAQGTIGDKGAQGTDGQKGIQGTDGAKGIQGADGLKGTQGTDGQKGVQGTDGAKGIQGTDGAKGIQGTDGQKGVTGTGTAATINSGTATGLAAGAAPTVANSGTISAAIFDFGIPSGAKGIKGEDGGSSSGAKGAQGTDGQKGVQGTDGAKGIKGEDGLKGIQGTDGQKGIQGTDGAKGIQGTGGLKGIQGTDGQKGIDGLKGIKGEIGAKGVQGTDGAKGAQGTDGAKGITGTGTAATIDPGTATGLAAGATPTVANSGTTSAAVFNFGIPAGDKGTKGDTGSGGSGGVNPEISNTVRYIASPLNSGREWQMVSTGDIYKDLTYSRAASTVTVISTAHGLTAGDFIVVRGGVDSYLYVAISNVTTNEFDYTSATSGTANGTDAAYIPAFGVSVFSGVTSTVVAPSAGNIQMSSMVVARGTEFTAQFTLNMPNTITNGSGANTSATNQNPPIIACFNLSNGGFLTSVTVAVNTSSNFSRFTLGGLAAGVNNLMRYQF